MDLLVVGAGGVGRWFARTVDASVAFADIDRDAARDAATALDGTVASLEGEDRYDAVCVAVPMGEVDRVLREQAARAEAAVVDVSGVMAGPVRAMRAVAPDRERLSLHPLFAPDRAPGSVAAVRDAAGPTTDAVVSALEAAGNDLVETTPAEHDEAMETIQAVTHAAILSFALAAESVPEDLTTPPYEAMATLADRLTAGTPRVYADIQATFDGADAVAAAAAEIADADGPALEALLETVGERRRGEPG